MKYLSILGQNPKLSIAELKSIYNINILEQTNSALIFESKQKVYLNKLGGTPKLAEILGEYKNINEAKKIIIKNLLKLPENKKIFFGLSYYNKKDKKSYKHLGINIKKELKNNDRKVRWVISQEQTLSSVVIKTNKLLTRGADYCLVFLSQASRLRENNRERGGNDRKVQKIVLAKTIDVQDFSDYEFRDMKRPARDLVSGITPPKLAKILINLASPLRRRGVRGDLIIDFLDPFCGSGTFLSEAALLGFKNVYGSDISTKAINDSIKNTTWLKNQYNLNTKFKIKKCNVIKANKCWNRKFNIIAGEGYLGPPIRGRINTQQGKKLQCELEKNYNNYLKGLSELLEKNGKLVLIVPFIIIGKNALHLNLDLKKYGLKSAQYPFLYSRPDQKIGRKIYILEKF